MEAIISVTIAVAKAILVTLPELRTKFKNPDTTPNFDVCTVLRMELLLGALKIPRPILWSIIPDITNDSGEETSILDNSTSADADINSPVTLNNRQPYRSDKRPLSGPTTTILNAFGTNISPTCMGL